MLSIVSAHVLPLLSVVDPCVSAVEIRAEFGTLTGISDTAVESVIVSLDEDGDVEEELEGIMMVF